MGVTILHAKSDSEVTSIEASTPPRSPRRPLYYVQSPSHDLEKMSYGSSPFGSPTHHYHYHCSPIHHSRESSTSRFSASLKHPRNAVVSWRRMQRKYNQMGDEEVNHEEGAEGSDKDDDSSSVDVWNLRFYIVCFLFSFVLLFTAFSLILWAASVPYKPKIIVKNIAFENFNVQAGMDGTGVATDMLTLNSTVNIFYMNPATFFGVHVTCTSLLFHYYDLKIASGHMNKFYQSRRSQRTVITLVQGYQVPLYGGIPMLSGAKFHLESVSVPLNLTFVMRSRAYILGRLVKPKFYTSVLCEVTMRSNNLGKPLNLTKSAFCVYN